MQGWEALAAALSIAYLLLAVREHLWCWYAGFASNAIYLFVFWDVSLLMDSALQVYYMGIAIYGWWQWQQGANADHVLPISRWPLHTHAIAIIAVLILSVISGLVLDRFTGAAHPFLDSFTTWGAVLTTWMVARKVLENWLYWIVIDSLAVYLYIERGLTITAVLFAAYTVIAVFGYMKWRAHYQEQATAQAD